MPISPDQLPKRLRSAFAAAGVEVTGSDPSPECSVVNPGFCDNVCYLLAMLTLQATDESVPDARLAEAAANLARDGESHGCPVLRLKK